MDIQIEDVKVTKRWKTVEDAKQGGFARLTTMFEACEAKERVELEMGHDLVHVKLRIKRHLGFYFVQARLR